jgi:N-acetylneuraminic acid mutarotase
VQDGWLYVVGGHTGGKHEHSTDNLSAGFIRRRLDSDGGWETLPGSFPLQSVALVSDGRYLYRVGGMTARNGPDEEEDLHSTAKVARFDPKLLRWSDLPPLPAPRSSHDAVVMDGKLYVAGGWKLAGSSDDGAWPTEHYVLELANPGEWRILPDARFQRRAVAVAGYRGLVYVLGGIDAEGEMSSRVDVLDVEGGVWSRGPDLPSHGFGASAFAAYGRLFISGMNGEVYALCEDGESWETVAKLQTRRFFHRLVAGDRGQLVFIGGANRSGHLESIEVLDVSVPRSVGGDRAGQASRPRFRSVP